MSTRDRSDAGKATTEAPADADAEGMARFLRGMTLGALVGAAIAGSAIWQRARNRPDAHPNEESTTETGDPR